MVRRSEGRGGGRACFRFGRTSRNRGSGRGCTGHRERRDLRTNAERQAVEFGVEIREYRGVVRVPRRMFQRLLLERPPPPERCLLRGARPDEMTLTRKIIDGHSTVR